METEQKAELKTTIMGKIDILKADITAFKSITKPVSPDNAIGRLTRMEAISSKSINEAALEKAKSTMANLERALARIDDPDFGLCRECEEPIAPARLMALPETELCIRCAERMGG
jgi:DnaK suppressor protein